MFRDLNSLRALFAHGTRLLPLIALMVVVAAPSAHAIDKCKVKVDKRTGVIQVSASGVAGTLLWGSASGEEDQAFFNDADCNVGGKAKKCELADPTTLASETPPADCRLYLDDGTAACVVRIPGCIPGSRDTAGSSAVCGDARIEGSEVCDGGELGGQTCQSAGFSYGTLGCSSCALDTSGCTNDRFVDNGDGTVTDHQTGLMWQQTTDDGTVRDKDNSYTWTGDGFGGTDPNGEAFFEFLAELNGRSPFAGHDDWRLPTITELESIVDQSQGNPTIDQAIFGPTGASSFYWSSSTGGGGPGFAWGVGFSSGTASLLGKSNDVQVRAVRGGS